MLNRESQPTLTEWDVESADSTAESANSTTDSDADPVKIGLLVYALRNCQTKINCKTKNYISTRVRIQLRAKVLRYLPCNLFGNFVLSKRCDRNKRFKKK